MMEIALHGLNALARVGVHPWETHERPVVLDLTLTVHTPRAATTDSLAHALDYDAVARAVRGVCGAQHYQLLETLLAAVGARLMEWPEVQSAFVRIHKPGALGDATDVSVAERFGRS